MNVRRGTSGRGGSIIRWLNHNERAVLLLLVAAALILRASLIAFAPTPYGYVWDFYYEGVRRLSQTRRLPVAADCWQCYHPPLFYVLGWPAYALGRWIAPHVGGDADMQGLRWLAGLATISAGVTIYYGYRLLRLFGCRGASLVIGVGLLVTFPCLFISSYGAEADIVLTAVLSAFLYYLTRDSMTAPSAAAALRLGVLAGLAAATKYSGLVAVTSGCVMFGLRAISGARRTTVLRHATVMIITCSAVGAWKYVDNYHRYGTPLYANGSAVEGFRITARPDFRRQYEFTTLRLAALMRLVGRRAEKGPLTELSIYRSVPTTLHALAWSDMTFFSEPTRHGDPSHPYPRKRIPVMLTRAVLILGFVPEVLAFIGFAVTIPRRIFRPLAMVCVVGAGAYAWWFMSQQQWGLKAKYLLFLLPAFVVYTVTGLAWVWQRARPAGIAAGVLIVSLLVLTHFYLLAFAIG